MGVLSVFFIVLVLICFFVWRYFVISKTPKVDEGIDLESLPAGTEATTGANNLDDSNGGTDMQFDELLSQLHQLKKDIVIELDKVKDQHTVAPDQTPKKVININHSKINFFNFNDFNAAPHLTTPGPMHPITKQERSDPVHENTSKRVHLDIAGKYPNLRKCLSSAFPPSEKKIEEPTAQASIRGKIVSEIESEKPKNSLRKVVPEMSWVSDTMQDMANHLQCEVSETMQDMANHLQCEVSETMQDMAKETIDTTSVCSMDSSNPFKD